MVDFNIVTTFGKQHAWGHDMVKSCDKFLPSNCSISVYIEDEMEDVGRVSYFPLDVDRIKRFEENFQSMKDQKIPRGIKPHTKIYNDRLFYFWDAARFCHKIFCMESAARSQTSRYLVWVDADVLFESEVPEDWLGKMTKEGCYTSYLHRKTRHAETGFIIFDTHHPYHLKWWDKVAFIYDNCSFQAVPGGWTDSHVHDYMVRVSGKEGVGHVKISNNANHAWNESPLIQHCRHFKGLRREGEHGSNKF